MGDVEDVESAALAVLTAAALATFDLATKEERSRIIRYLYTRFVVDFDENEDSRFGVSTASGLRPLPPELSDAERTFTLYEGGMYNHETPQSD